MVRVTGVLVLAGVLGGCTTVKMVQRDGCWVRQTKTSPGGTREELGPCMRAEPRWSEDRLTRLVQECIAHEDYRWQVRALAAFGRSEPLPPREAEETVIETCMNEAAAGVVTRNETLAQRLAELSLDRDALRADADASRTHLRTSHERIAGFLGEAAKRPPPTATASATATSDGSARTENGFSSETGSTSQMLPAAVIPAVPAAASEAAPAAEPKPAKALDRVRARRKPVVRATRAAPPAGCELPGAAPAAAIPPSELAAHRAAPEAAPAAPPATPAEAPPAR